MKLETLQRKKKKKQQQTFDAEYGKHVQIYVLHHIGNRKILPIHCLPICWQTHKCVVLDCVRECHGPYCIVMYGISFFFIRCDWEGRGRLHKDRLISSLAETYRCVVARCFFFLERIYP